MDEYGQARLDGAKIFRAGVKYIEVHGWDHNTMDILLAVTPGKRWPQPMAVLMFSELENALEGQTLTNFDLHVPDEQGVIDLFNLVADSLSGDIISP